METTKRKTTKQFIEEAIKAHGNKYDYSKVEYKNAKTKVIITCPVHGEFEQLPTNHLNGQGCKRCFNDKVKSNTQEFIDKARSIHGDRYDYSKVDYKQSFEEIVVICGEHGEFKQTPHDHLKGRNCPACCNTSKTCTKEEFIDKAKDIHDDWYSYSKVNYNHSKNKVTITCPIHGDFEQIPNDHLNGAGCYECAKERFGFWNPEYIRKHHPDKLNNPCTLYVLECYSEEERFIKVGITTTTIEERYKNKLKEYYQYDTLYEYHSTLIHCSENEQELLRYFKEYKYEPMNKFGGSSECIDIECKDEILEVVKQK